MTKKKKSVRNCGVCHQDIKTDEFDEHKAECWSGVVLKNRIGVQSD